jgi:hypothetical protein
MHTPAPVSLIRDTLVLLLFAGLAGAAVTGLVQANAGPAPVVLVVAIMTPLVCSAAVQLGHRLRLGANGDPTHPEGS